MGKRRVRATPSFDAECYALRYDEQRSLEEIAAEVGASAATVRHAIRRHAATLCDDPVEDERFGATLRWQEEVARVSRRLAAGESPDAVLADARYANRRSMLAAVRKYRRRAGKKTPDRMSGVVTVQNMRGSPQVVLNVPAMRAAKWKEGDTVIWRIDGTSVVLRPYNREERPHPALCDGDRDALAWMLHYTEGKTWAETARTLGMSPSGAWSAAKRFADRHPERGLPSSTRSRASDNGTITVVRTPRGPSLRFCVPAIRLGWQPGQKAAWEWDPARRRIVVTKYVPPAPPPIPKKRKSRRASRRDSPQA